MARAALKYLALDGRCDVVASGSLLGIRFKEEAALASIPVGYEREVEMGPLDFEEYLWVRGYGEDDIANLREYYESLMPVPVAVNQKMMQMLREYLAVGGMPAVVDAFAPDGQLRRCFRRAKQAARLVSRRRGSIRASPRARACAGVL